MRVHSLGYRTDFIFHRFDGQVLDRGEYLVVRTPSNPTYHWGNFLLFQEPPQDGDFERWKQLFTTEIGPPEQVGHMAVGWDAADGRMGEVKPFLQAGFEPEHSLVLAAAQVRKPPKFNNAVTIQPLQNDAQWEQALQLQVLCRPPKYSPEGYRVFKERKMERYRAMTQAGLGQWFGAFLGERLAADLGIFAQGELGRFQTVETHPDLRRRGICGALVYEASRHAFERMGVRTLVMVADEDYHAKDIYQSVGFKVQEKQAGVCWWKRPS